MASTFAWVEEQKGKAQILFGARILKDNLQNEISLSPMDTTLNKAKLGPARFWQRL
jgi:hypothetical protein